MLIEEEFPDTGEVKGKATNTKTVFLQGANELMGKVVQAKITGVRKGSLVGEILDEY